MLALVLWMVIRLRWILSSTEHVLSELKDCTRMALQRKGEDTDSACMYADKTAQGVQPSLYESRVLSPLRSILLPVVLLCCMSEPPVAFTLGPDGILLHLMTPAFQLCTVQPPAFSGAGTDWRS